MFLIECCSLTCNIFLFMLLCLMFVCAPSGSPPSPCFLVIMYADHTISWPSVIFYPFTRYLRRCHSANCQLSGLVVKPRWMVVVDLPTINGLCTPLTTRSLVYHVSLHRNRPSRYPVAQPPDLTSFIPRQLCIHFLNLLFTHVTTRSQ